MPKITMPSAYFNAQQLKESGEQTLTIKGCQLENVAPEDKPEEKKWVVYFNETDSGVVLNSSRLEQLVNVFGTNESEQWYGKKVMVYCDPNIKFGGKKIGGVAFKAVSLFTNAADLSGVK